MKNVADTGKQNIQKVDVTTMSREDLIKEYNRLHEQYNEISSKLSWYEEQYRLSKLRSYGQSSEADMGDQITIFDLPMFNEAEALKEMINIEPDIPDLEEETKTSHKKSRKKETTNLPVVTTEYTISEEEQICPKCGGPLHNMSKKVRVEIEVIPAKVQMHRFVTYVYSCRKCEESDDAVIVNAPGAPVPVIERSPAGASLIADIIAKKYVDAVPFYRQERNYKHQGIPVTRNNLCNWSIKVANDYFKFIVNRMREAMYADQVIHCDETNVQVLAEPGKSATSKSYVWVTTTAEFQKATPVAIYNYTRSRSQTDAREVLKGYKGYIMCDGYAVYDSIAAYDKKTGAAAMEVKPVACLVHVRRKFAEALKLLKPEFRTGTGAQTAINKLETIFREDNRLTDLAPENRKEARNGKLRDLLEDFFSWAKEEYGVSLHETHYGKALEYALKEETKVMRVFEDGRLELENNLAERTVKPFVIGRKNWLFADTPHGAEASCILYSVVQTAIMNGLIPFEYIKYLLETMPGKALTDDFIESLLPWSKTIPEYVKVPENREE